MSKNIWSVSAVTSLSDSDYFYVGIYDDTTPTLNKILVPNAFADIYDSIDGVEDKIPTKVSDLTNDAGYLTEHQSLSGYVTESTLSAYALTSSIPTKVSDLTNDANYISSIDLSSYATQLYVNTALNNLEIETDDTLQREGVPADAAAVGAALDSIEVTIDTDGAGQPVPVTTVDSMEDTSVMYLYLGDEEGYEYGYVYCFVNGEWTASIHAYGTITMAGAVFSDNAIDLLETILKAGTYSTSQTANINSLIAELRDSF